MKLERNPIGHDVNGQCWIEIFFFVRSNKHMIMFTKEFHGKSTKSAKACNPFAGLSSMTLGYSWCVAWWELSKKSSGTIVTFFPIINIQGFPLIESCVVCIESEHTVRCIKTLKGHKKGHGWLNYSSSCTHYSGV